jgi:transaldolase
MTVVVANTGGIEAVRRLKPQDCTTNATLLKAVENPAYAHLVEEAVGWGRGQGGNPDAVGAATTDLMRLIGGRDAVALRATLRL